MNNAKRQFNKKQWHFELWSNQLSPFLKYLKESQKITQETTEHIWRSLMMDSDELQQHQEDNKNAEWITPDYKSRAKNLVLVEPEYTKDELLKNMKEQNYFTDGDVIKNVDELREEYVSFVKKQKIEMKQNQVNSILWDLDKVEIKKSNLQRIREDFIKKNDEDQGKCDAKINEFKKQLQKKWYKVNN